MACKHNTCFVHTSYHTIRLGWPANTAHILYTLHSSYHTTHLGWPANITHVLYTLHTIQYALDGLQTQHTFCTPHTTQLILDGLETQHTCCTHFIPHNTPWTAYRYSTHFEHTSFHTTHIGWPANTC